MFFVAISALPVLGGGAPAAAHSFLAQTEPVQGARLQAPPDEVVLRLSEPVAEASVRISLRPAGGARVPLASTVLSEDGRVVRVGVPRLGQAVYVASWRVVSAIDGHESAGEFAFAVGEVSGVVPTSSSGAAPTDWPAVAAGGLFLGGSALASGGLIGALLHLPGPRPHGRRRLVLAGLVVAVVGAQLRLPAFGVTSGGSPADLDARLAVVALALALMLVAVRRRPLPPLLAIGTAWLFWSAGGHAAAEGRLGLAVDVTHLAAGALWLGALTQLGVGLWRADGDTWPGLRQAALRYARLALVLVAALAVAGVVSALRLVPRLEDLWSSAYGVVVVVKIHLLVAAVLLALAARTRGLRRGAGPTRRLVVGETLILGAAMAMAALLTQLAPPRPAEVAASLLGPPPMEGPVARGAGLAGTVTVEIAAGDGRFDLRVLTPSGGVEGVRVDASARFPVGTTTDLHPRPCGPGCFTQALTLPVGETVVEVAATAPEWTGGTVAARLHWPPPPARPELFERMAAAMKAVPTVVVDESVSSRGPARPPSGKGGIEMSGAELVALMPWAGGGVVDVRPLPDEVRAFTFYLPGSHMLFVAHLDEQGRLSEQRLVNPSHDIRYRFTYPPESVPPDARKPLRSATPGG